MCFCLSGGRGAGGRAPHAAQRRTSGWQEQVAGGLPAWWRDGCVVPGIGTCPPACGHTCQAQAVLPAASEPCTDLENCLFSTYLGFCCLCARMAWRGGAWWPTGRLLQRRGHGCSRTQAASGARGGGALGHAGGGGRRGREQGQGQGRPTQAAGCAAGVTQQQEAVRCRPPDPWKRRHCWWRTNALTCHANALPSSAIHANPSTSPLLATSFPGHAHAVLLPHVRMYAGAPARPAGAAVAAVPEAGLAAAALRAPARPPGLSRRPLLLHRRARHGPA